MEVGSLNILLNCDSNAESKLQWQSLKGLLEQHLDWGDLASTYVLCPSNSLVPNFKLEMLEVLNISECQTRRSLVSQRARESEVL